MKFLSTRWRRPKKTLSVVVVVYNIPREAPRTLFSLSADYQRHIAPEDYEVSSSTTARIRPSILKSSRIWPATSG